MGGRRRRLEGTEALSRALQVGTEKDSEERLSQREGELALQLANSEALLEVVQKRLEMVERSMSEMERKSENDGPRLIVPGVAPAPTPNGAIALIKHALSYLSISTFLALWYPRRLIRLEPRRPKPED
jgi:hypothetical protein